MATQFTASPGDQMLGIAAQYKAGGVAISAAKVDAMEDMALYLERRVVNAFRGETDMAGRPWPKMSGLTRKLKAVLGGSGRLGLGKRGAMRESFRLGQPGNIYRVEGDSFTWGSGLRRGKQNSVVANTFERMFTMPTSASDHKAAGRIRRWMGAVIGEYRPGKGKVLTHPARRILAMPPDIRAQLRTILATKLADAIRKLLRGMMGGP